MTTEQNGGIFTVFFVVCPLPLIRENHLSLHDLSSLGESMGFDH